MTLLKGEDHCQSLETWKWVSGHSILVKQGGYSRGAERRYNGCLKEVWDKGILLNSQSAKTKPRPLPSALCLCAEKKKEKAVSYYCVVSLTPRKDYYYQLRSCADRRPGKEKWPAHNHKPAGSRTQTCYLPRKLPCLTLRHCSFCYGLVAQLSNDDGTRLSTYQGLPSPTWLPLFFHIKFYGGTARPIVDILSLATFGPYSLSLVVMPETVWPTKPRIFIIRSFTEAACQYFTGLSCLNLTASCGRPDT